MSKLSNKIAIVTGGTRGIGAAIAVRLASEGATVAVTYAGNTEKAAALVAEIEAAGGKAIAIQADSGDAEAVKATVNRVAKEFGKIDILVNNAGIVGLGQIGEFAEAEFERLININVRGVFYATQEAVKHMGPGGRIVMIGSVNSESMPFAGGSVYALTKGAVASFVRGLARDLGPRGITVNNVQPGPIDTEMNPEDGPIAAMVKGFLAVGRYGKANEVAALVSYLVSEEAANVTSAQIRIDGGFAA